MDRHRFLTRIDAADLVPVIRDLRLARAILEPLFVATSAMQEVLLPAALATEEAIARRILQIAARVVGRPNDPAISFALATGEMAIMVYESGETVMTEHIATEPDDVSLLSLTPRGEA